MQLREVAQLVGGFSDVLLQAGRTVPDMAPSPYSRRLCAALDRLRGAVTIPADDINADGSILFSRERLRVEILAQSEVTRLLGNMLALAPSTPESTEAGEFLAEHSQRLTAAGLLAELTP